MTTVIRENFVVKKPCLAQNDENFLLVILHIANIWYTFDMNKNSVTQKFLTKILRLKLMRIMVLNFAVSMWKYYRVDNV